MPGNVGTIGKDVTVDVVTSTGVQRFKNITAFGSKQLTTALESKPLDGTLLFDELPAGWEGKLDFDRFDSTVDDYFAAREEAYYGGLAADTITITETIQEKNGSITQYRYTGVALKFDNAGDKEAEKVVKQNVAFKAARRRKIL